MAEGFASLFDVRQRYEVGDFRELLPHGPDRGMPVSTVGRARRGPLENLEQRTIRARPQDQRPPSGYKLRIG